MKSLMKTISIATVISFAICSYATIAATNATASKIGYVSTAKVMTELAKKVGLQKMIETEFKDRINEVKTLQTRVKADVDNLQKNGATMTEAQRTDLQRKAENNNSTLQLKGKALQEDQRKRASEEENKLIEKVRTAIQTVAKKDNYDLVVDAQIVLFANDKTKDLSDEVLAAVAVTAK